jgi:hypothetical protein
VAPSAPGSWTPPLDTYFGHASTTGAPPPHTRRRGALAVAAAVVAAVCVAVSVVVVLGGGATTNASAAVIDAVNSSLAGKTAHVTLTESVQEAGQGFTVNGTGTIDFNQNALDLQASGNVAGQQLNLELMYVGGTMYLQIPGISQVEPGRSWVSLDLSSIANQSGGGGAGALGSGGNPTATLQLLAQQGNTVTPIGSSTVDGVDVQGYQVTLSRAAIEAELAKANLPSWMRQAASNVNIGDTSYKVYVDGHGLLRREAISMQIGVSSQQAAVSVQMDFTDYGAPVNVQAPPADQVVDFSTFLQDAQAASGQ